MSNNNVWPIRLSEDTRDMVHNPMLVEASFFWPDHAKGSRNILGCTQGRPQAAEGRSYFSVGQNLKPEQRMGAEELES